MTLSISCVAMLTYTPAPLNALSQLVRACTLKSGDSCCATPDPPLLLALPLAAQAALKDLSEQTLLKVAEKSNEGKTASNQCGPSG
jgi:hypothetical protein